MSDKNIILLQTTSFLKVITVRCRLENTDLKSGSGESSIISKGTNLANIYLFKVNNRTLEKGVKYVQSYL